MWGVGGNANLFFGGLGSSNPIERLAVLFARFVPAFLARIVRALYKCIRLSCYGTNHNN